MVKRLLLVCLLLSLAGVARAGTYQDFEAGNRAQREGRYLDAAAIFTKLIDLKQFQDPYQAALHLNRGNALVRLERLDQALADYTQAIKLNPKLTAAWFNRGNLRLQKGKLDEARLDFDEVLKRDQGNAWASNNRGWIFLVRGKLKEALVDFDRAVASDPSLPEPRNNRGEARLSLGDHKGAREDFTKAAELARTKRLAAAALTNLGLAWAQAGRFREAVDAFTRALAKNPSYAHAHFNRAAAWERLGDLRKALVDMAAFRRLAPNNPAGTRDWAELNSRLRSSRKTAQEAAANRVRNRLPEEPVDWGAAQGASLARARQGLAAQKKGDAALALDLYSLAIASGGLPPRALARVHNNRGLAWRQLGKDHRALNDFFMAVGLDRAYVDGYLNRADLWRKMGRRGEALKDLDLAVALAPDHAMVRLARAVFLLETGRDRKAEEDYSKALALAPSLAAAHVGRAIARERQGRLDRALEDARAYVRLAPGDKMGHRLLARLALAREKEAQRPREKSQEPPATAK